MRYKIGKILEVFNKELNQRIDWLKLISGYKVVYYIKKQNAWKLMLSYETKDKKYSERKFFELLERKFRNLKT